MNDNKNMAKEYARKILAKKMAKGGVAEESDSGETLGKKIGFPGFSEGGLIEDDIYDLSDQEAEDTSGEPHEEGKKEEEDPMEYMSEGGKVAFAKALRKSRGMR